MRAVYYEEFGGSDKLKLGKLPDPDPGPGEVVIRIAAAGVNPIDWKIREGRFDCIIDHAFPIIPGWDAAGTIVAIGDGVDSFVTGDRVFAYTRKSRAQDGTYAEFIAVPASYVSPMPQNLEFYQAAALPLCMLTAWQALCGFADIGGGESVLIQAGAGGVGSMAIQIAALRGARVITTASAVNASYCRSLGASMVVDYRERDVFEMVETAAPDGLDCLFEMVWDERDPSVLDRCLSYVREGGAVITLNEPANEKIVAERSLRATRLFSEPVGTELAVLGGLIGAGKLKLPEIHRMPLEAASAAMDLSKKGHVRGKIVLEI